MATLVSDNFDTIGTADIFDRTPVASTIGAKWRRQSGQAFGGDSAGRVQPQNDGCSASIDTGASDLDISVDLIWVSSVSRFTVGAMTNSVFNPTDQGGYIVWNTDDSNIRLSWLNASGVRTDYAPVSAGLTFATGTTYTLRLLVNGTSVKFYINGVERISQTDANVSVRPHACLGGTGVGVGFANARYDNFVVSSVGGSDVTAPTLTSATATATGANTATGGVTTNEAGPAWAVLTTSSTTPSAAQIKAGQNHTGATASASDTATLSVGANPGVFDFTGLTGGGTYWLHVVQDDTATPANTATPITSASSITTPTPDTTSPTWPGGTTLGASNKTDTTVTLTTSADATDNVAVAGYEWSSDDGASYPFTSLTKTFQFTALSALNSYQFKSRAYDAAGNKSAAISLTTSTYRAGDTAANILANTGPVGGNPAGFLYAFASTVSSTDWLSYTIVSGPTPSGGTLDASPDGTFTYVGPDAATLVIQPEVNGANAAETITVTLYDQSPDTELPVLTGSITVTNLTSTSYDLSWPTGTDNTGIAGYEYSLNGGASWTDNGNVTTKAITGRTPESTDEVRVRAYDAAGNKSTPALSTSVTLLAGPDVTAPLLSLPTAYASGPTTASGTVTTNEATGTLYYLRNNSATATDVAVKAGLSQAVTASGIQTVNVTGLTASTPGNYIHYLHQDGSGNDSLVSSSAAFTTPAEPAPGVVSDEVGFRSCMRYPMESAIKGALA